MSQEVLPCGLLDCAVLSRLHGLCFSTKWEASEFEILLPMPGVFGWFIRDMTQLSTTYGGFVLARIAGDEGEIISIGVVPDCRGQGLGKKLVRAVEAKFKTEGALELLLEVAETNDLALHFYKSLSFKIVGRRIGYYCDQVNSRTDALIMKRCLL